MAKYSFQIKKKVVTAYLNGEGSYHKLPVKYNIDGKCQVRKWVNLYNEFFLDEGLFRSRNNKTYSFEYKLNVVKLYLSSEVFYQELAYHKE